MCKILSILNIMSRFLIVYPQINFSKKKCELKLQSTIGIQ